MAKGQRNSRGAGGDTPKGRPVITLQKQAIHEALIHARTHLERADQAARSSLASTNEAHDAPYEQLRKTLTQDAKEAAQHIAVENDRAVAAITSMLSKQLGQTVRAIEEQEQPPSWTVWADQVTTVGSLGHLVPEDHPDYERIVFVDGDDREAVRRYAGAEAEDYGSFFVLVGDGEYDAVWGMEGIVPGLHKSLDRLEVN